MNRSEQILEMVKGGEVLDEHWNWVPLKKQIEKEKGFIDHLVAGHVLFDGKWVGIADARQFQSDKQRRMKEADEHRDEVQLSAGERKFHTPEGDEIPPPPETVLITEETAMSTSLQEVKMLGLSSNIDLLGSSDTIFTKKTLFRNILMIVLGTLLSLCAAATGLYFLFYDLFQW